MSENNKPKKIIILKIVICLFVAIGIFFTVLSLYLYFTPVGENDKEGLFVQAKQKYSDDKKFEDMYVYGLGFIKRVMDPNGAHHIQFEYDENGKIVQIKNFDRKGNMVMEFPEENVAYIRTTYDENGQFSKMEFYNTEENLMLRNGEYAISELNRAPNGDVLEIKYYGTDEELLLQKEGYAIKRNEYDENRNIIKESYF